jgi:hypothetical protein
VPDEIIYVLFGGEAEYPADLDGSRLAPQPVRFDRFHHLLDRSTTTGGDVVSRHTSTRTEEETQRTEGRKEGSACCRGGRWKAGAVVWSAGRCPPLSAAHTPPAPGRLCAADAGALVCRWHIRVTKEEVGGTSCPGECQQ